MLGQPADQIGVADDGHAVLDDRLTGFGELAVTALFGCHVDDDTARLHALHHLGGDQPGGRFPGDQRGGDDDVDFTRLFGIHFALRLQEALAHDLGVTAATRAFLLVIDLDEFATERDDLIGNLRTRVIGADDRAQTGGSTNGGEAGDTGAGDEDLGRLYLACSRDLAVEEATKGIGGLNHGPIAGNAGL